MLGEYSQGRRLGGATGGLGHSHAAGARSPGKSADAGWAASSGLGGIGWRGGDDCWRGRLPANWGDGAGHRVLRGVGSEDCAKLRRANLGSLPGWLVVVQVGLARAG